MASFVWGRGSLRLLIGNAQATTIDYLNDAGMKIGLSTNVHVPNKDDTFIDDGGADDFVDGELAGGGYARQALAGKTMAYDAANDRVELDANDTVFTAINAGTAAQATMMKDTAVATTSPGLANIDSGGFPVVTNGGDVTLQWNAEGIIQLTV